MTNKSMLAPGLRFSATSAPGQTITNRVPWANIGGLIWGKPDMYNSPKVTNFVAMDMPAQATGFSGLYAQMAGQMNNGAITNYAAWGWNSPTPKTSLDIIIQQWMSYFSAPPTNVAIALNFDDSVTAPSPYYYDFATDDPAQVDPPLVLTAGDMTNQLGFIQNDPFTFGKVTEHYTVGGTLIRRKTVIFVCPVVSSARQSYVPFNVSYLEALKADAGTGNPQYFDPKIRNDG